MMPKKFVLFCLLLLLISSIPVNSGHAASPEAVYLIPIEGAIEPGLAEFVARIIREADQANAAVLLEINTFGGRVDAATEIRDLIIRADMPVVSYVTARAWSAGALITLAAPNVAMAPGSSMGAAQPQPADEKTISALRSEFEATAERAGRDPRIAAAMVDADIEIEGLVQEGKILTLAANRAAEEGFSDLIAASRQEVLAFFDLDHLNVIEFTPNWAERMARIVTEPTVSSLLLTLGFMGLIFEITTMGWGIPGTVGIASLALFFGGRLITGLAGLEVIILFLVGLILLFVEIFILPGFGVAGGLGVVSMFTGIFLAFGNVQTALFSILVAVSASLLLIILTWNRLTKSGAWRRLVLTHREDKELGYKGPKTYVDLVGKEGTTLTPLRPAGTALVEGERYDVVSEGGYVTSGKQIKVVKIEGTRIIVREMEDNDK